MQRQKHRRSRAAHNAPEVSHSTHLRPTHLGPHSRSHVYLTHSGSYPEVAAPSAAVAELYTTPGTSGSQCPSSREKHLALPSFGHGKGYNSSTTFLPPSSNPERRKPHQGRTARRLTHKSSPAHRSHSNKEDHFVDCRRDSGHLHGESRSSTRDQPRLDSQPSTTSENRDVFEPADYIRAWQGTLRPTIPPNASSIAGVGPTGADVPGGLPQNFTTFNHFSVAARSASNPIVKGTHEPNSSHTIHLGNRFTSGSTPPPRNSSWLSWFGFGKKPVKPTPQPALRDRTVVNRKKVLTGPHSSSPVIPPPMPAASSGTVRVPAPSRPQNAPRPACPPHLQHASTATQPLVSRPRTTVDVAVQTIDQSESFKPYPDPPSPVPSLSWLLEEDTNDDDGPSVQPTISIMPESNAVDNRLPQRAPSPLTNIHSLFPPLPPHIPQPEVQVDAVLDVVKSVYAAHPEVACTGIGLLVPFPFRQSCPEFYLFDGLQYLDNSYMRLMSGFCKLNVFYDEINRKPDNTNPSPEFIPIPSPQIPQDSCAHRWAVGGMLTNIVKFKWILHILYGTTVGMTGFLRADDTVPIDPEEGQIYVKMRDDIRRFTDRARGSYIPPIGVRPRDELDLDEVRNLVEMLILAGGKMFTRDMSQPIVTPPTLPPAGPFLVADRLATVAAQEATTTSQAEVQLAGPGESSTTSARHSSSTSTISPPAPPPAYEANSNVNLGSNSPGLNEPSAGLRLPNGFLPISHPQGGVRWSDSRKREDVLWGTESTVAKEMRTQFVERIASEHSILSPLLDMAGDDPVTKTALAVIVQKYLGEYVPKERKDATSRDDLWSLISGPEAFMGMAEVVREVAVQLSSQRDNPAGLDGYIMKRLVEALMKRRDVKPEFVQAFSALKGLIPQQPRTVPPTPIQADADSKSKRKRTDDDQKEPEHAESPSKRRKLEDARKMPPPPKSISSSTRVSTSAASSKTQTIGGVTISKAHASSSATTFGGAAPTNGSRLTSLHRTPSVAQNYSRCDNSPSKNIRLSPGQQFKKRSEFHGKLHRPSRFASPGVRILPPSPDHFGYSERTTASSSQASASASTSTADSSSVEVDSSTSSHTTESQEPVWKQPVHIVKRADITKSLASASTLTRSSSLSVISSTASSTAQVASGSCTSLSSRATASSYSASASSPWVPGAHSTGPSSSGPLPYGDLRPSVSNSEVRFAGQSGPPVVSGWEGDMQTVSGTSIRAVSSSSASSRGFSVALHPANWDVEMNDDEFEEIDVFAAD